MSPKKKARTSPTSTRGGIRGKMARMAKANETKKGLVLECRGLIRDNKVAAAAAATAAVKEGADNGRSMQLRPKPESVIILKDKQSSEKCEASTSGFSSITSAITSAELSQGLEELKNMKKRMATIGVCSRPVYHEHTGYLSDIKSALPKEFYLHYVENISDQYEDRIQKAMKRLTTSTNGAVFGLDIDPIINWPRELDIFRDSKCKDPKIKQTSSLVFKKIRLLVKLNEAMCVAVTYKLEYRQLENKQTDQAVLLDLTKKVLRLDRLIEQIQDTRLELIHNSGLICQERVRHYESLIRQMTINDGDLE